MAQKGTYTAYQRLSPLEADFVTPVQNVVAEKRRLLAEEEKRRKERQAQKEQLAKDFASDYSTLTEVVTNNKTIDEAFARGISVARDTMGEIYRQIQRNPSLASDVAIQMKLQNLRNFSKNLKTVSDKYTSYAQTVAAGMQDGSLSEWNSETLSDMDSLFASLNLNVTVDQSTGIPRAVIAKVDENGDPVRDEDGDIVLKDLNLVEVLDGRGLTGLVQKYDFLKGVQDLGSNVGEREVTKEGSDFRTIEYQKFEDVEGEVRKLVNSQLGTAKRPSAVAKSIWADAMGREPKKLTEDDLKEVQDYFVESIGTFYNEKNKNSIDYSARTAASREARQRAKDEQEMGPEFTLDVDERGDIVEENKSQAGPGISGKSISFTPKQEFEIRPGKQPVTVSKIYYNKDEDKIFYSGIQYVGKKTKKVYEKGLIDGGSISEPIIEEKIDGSFEGTSLIPAKLKGVKNLEELKQEMLRQEQQQRQKNQTGAVQTGSGNVYQ